MTYLLWITLALAHLIGMAITHGMERHRTFKPDPIVYALWEMWLAVWAVGFVGTVVRDALRWVFTALDDIGHNIGGRM